jgi:hypothetical protein
MEQLRNLTNIEGDKLTERFSCMASFTGLKPLITIVSSSHWNALIGVRIATVQHASFNYHSPSADFGYDFNTIEAEVIKLAFFWHVSSLDPHDFWPRVSDCYGKKNVLINC